MNLALIIAGTSFALLILFGFLFSREEKAGKRFFLREVRFVLDNAILSVAEAFHRLFTYIVKYVITLSWYYSLHAFLAIVLRFLSSVYYIVEGITHRNRDRARKIRQDRKQAAKSHLDLLTDHKVDTKLTDQQKKRLKEKAMKGS